MKRAVVILSGGLDSTVCLALAKSRGLEPYALTFNYGQSHCREVKQAQKVAAHYQARHKVIDISFFKDIGGSALTDSRLEIPVDRPESAISQGIPATYVPFRNGVFLSLACSYAEVVGAEEVYIGVNALDYSGYPDCRPEFIEAFQQAVRVGTKQCAGDGREIKIMTPLLDKTKAEIVRLGMDLQAPLHLTTSCYRGGEKACGHCDSCQLRLKGFREAGFADPIEYEEF